MRLQLLVGSPSASAPRVTICASNQPSLFSCSVRSRELARGVDVSEVNQVTLNAPAPAGGWLWMAAIFGTCAPHRAVRSNPAGGVVAVAQQVRHAERGQRPPRDRGTHRRRYGCGWGLRGCGLCSSGDAGRAQRTCAAANGETVSAEPDPAQRHRGPCHQRWWSSAVTPRTDPLRGGWARQAHRLPRREGELTIGVDLPAGQHTTVGVVAVR